MRCPAGSAWPRRSSSRSSSISPSSARPRPRGTSPLSWSGVLVAPSLVRCLLPGRSRLVRRLPIGLVTTATGRLRKAHADPRVAQEARREAGAGRPVPDPLRGRGDSHAPLPAGDRPAPDRDRRRRSCHRLALPASHLVPPPLPPRRPRRACTTPACWSFAPPSTSAPRSAPDTPALQGQRRRGRLPHVQPRHVRRQQPALRHVHAVRAELPQRIAPG